MRGSKPAAVRGKSRFWRTAHAAMGLDHSAPAKQTGSRALMEISKAGEREPAVTAANAP